MDALRSLDVGSTSADAVQARAHAALVKLDQLQAMSEGQFDTPISSLRSTINDIKQSAVDAGDAFAAARQERQDAVQRLAQNLRPLKQRLDVQCSAAGLSVGLHRGTVMGVSCVPGAARLEASVSRRRASGSWWPKGRRSGASRFSSLHHRRN
jgi:hypothetical protein